MQKPIVSKHETIKHFMTKAVVMKLLRDAGGSPHFEVDTGSGYADVFDRKTGMVYEVQESVTAKIREEKLNKYKKYALVMDVIIIPLNKVWSDSVKELVKNVKEWII